jgi:acid phosphatase
MPRIALIRRSCALVVAAVAALCSPTWLEGGAGAAEPPANDARTLRATILVVRHSTISPKYSLPKDPVTWPMGFEQLTAVGMRQMFDMGQSWRRKYVEELKFLPAQYKVSDLYVRASATDRALQTAQMLVLGLFPPGTGPDPSIYDKSLKAAPAPELAFTAVPIRSVPLEDDRVMRPWTKEAGCTKYRNYLNALPNSALYKHQAKAYEPFIRRISELTGVMEDKEPSRILYDINEIYEPLTANVAHNLPLPKGILAEDMELMSDLSDWNYHHHFLGKEIGRLTGGSFVGEVVGRFAGAIQSKGQAPKLLVYSGHQRTILGIEAALGIETWQTKGPLFKGRIVPLGAYYAFELHEPAPGDYAVRLAFVSEKGERTVPLPGCPAGLCPFKQFAAAVTPVIPADWRRECGKGA